MNDFFDIVNITIQKTYEYIPFFGFHRSIVFNRQTYYKCHTLAFFPTGESIHILFRFILNKPKASALWTTLTSWVLYEASTVTVLTDYHAIPFRVEGSFVRFLPPAKLLAIRVVKLQ
jgi:hypothetical protein